MDNDSNNPAAPARSGQATGYAALVERVEALAASMRAGCSNTCIAHPYPRMHTNSVCQCLRSAGRQLLDCAVEAERLQTTDWSKAAWCKMCGWSGETKDELCPRCRDMGYHCPLQRHNKRLTDASVSDER